MLIINNNKILGGLAKAAIIRIPILIIIKGYKKKSFMPSINIIAN